MSAFDRVSDGHPDSHGFLLTSPMITLPLRIEDSKPRSMAGPSVMLKDSALRINCAALFLASFPSGNVLLGFICIGPMHVISDVIQIPWKQEIIFESKDMRPYNLVFAHLLCRESED